MHNFYSSHPTNQIRLLWLASVLIVAILLLLSLVFPVKAQFNIDLLFNSGKTLLNELQAVEETGECFDSQCFEGMARENINLYEHVLIGQLTEADMKSLAVLESTPLAEAKIAIAKSSIKYSVPVGFFTGIAFAESSAHQHYYMESDKHKCHNPWGLKPRNGQREDGSYLICFESWDQSTEYFGKLLKEGYMDRGAKTIEGVAPYYKCGGWDGTDWCLATIDNWIRNVSAYSYF